MKEENLEFSGSFKSERGLLRMFVKDVARIRLLTPEEEIRIARRSRAGDEAARNLLVESNLRYVVKVANRYWSPGLPLMDMVSEGYRGLMKAASTFDPDKGFRFLTYAGDAIAQSVTRAIADHKRHGHDSLDEHIYGDESEVSQGDVLASEAMQGDEMAFLNQVRDKLNLLDDRERMIVTLRFWHSLTLEEVGKRIHVAKETVRKIEARALRKLRWAIDDSGQIWPSLLPQQGGRQIPVIGTVAQLTSHKGRISNVG